MHYIFLCIFFLTASLSGMEKISFAPSFNESKTSQLLIVPINSKEEKKWTDKEVQKARQRGRAEGLLLGSVSMFMLCYKASGREFKDLLLLPLTIYFKLRGN
jgi:hypothetical protein